MKRLAYHLLLLLSAPFLLPPLSSAVPLEVNYQGLVSVSDVPFEGTGLFKFALLNDASVTVWSHDGTSVNGSEPASAIRLAVSHGSYSVALGDTSVPNMTALTSAIFAEDALLLRLWFSDGTNAFEALLPDHPIQSVAFAIRAGIADSVSTLPEGLIEERHLPAALLDRIAVLETRLSEVSLETTTTVSTEASDGSLIALGYEPFTKVPASSWASATADNAPGARTEHAAVWTGDRMIVWGGRFSGTHYLNSGAAYQPATDTWTALSPVDAPSARSRHTLIWTGAEMIVWGGSSSALGYLGDGARYHVATQQWLPMTGVGAPSGRQGHVSVWTGNQLIVWGGRNADGPLVDGGLYDPVQNAWIPLSLPDPPEGRIDAAAVWAGDRLIVWGGMGIGGPLDDGSQLLFADDEPAGWSALGAAGAPSARNGHTMVWTGGKAVVFGGEHNSTLLNDGASFDPVNDTWTPLSTVNAPSARAGHVSVWTGTEMLVMGGRTAFGGTSTGLAFNPFSDQWRSLSNAGNPLARSGARAVWSGEEILIFGGRSNGQPVASLQRLNPKQTVYFYRKP